uniref:L1 transposable element RRM domain-containing protein n=1 Tax=Myotis myotis TaxID=51298 RepID=A0A7J7ZX06_MYOMY|nr:hypothetical protein mMyoMyo1_009728 [Myotis myotis]
MSENQKEKPEDSLRLLWNYIKQQYSHNRCARRRSGQGKENVFEEIVAENVHNIVKENVTQVQEAQRVPSKKIPNRPKPRHIIIKMPKIKDKEKILKAVREKQFVIYNGAPIRLLADFSSENLQARRKWHEVSRS